MKKKPTYNPKIHHRRSIRLKGYDYSQAGLYFITICVQNRECLFGEIIEGRMILNDAGKMVEAEWLNLKTRFPNIELYEHIVMPNHFHAILQIVGATLVVAQNDDENQNDQIAHSDHVAQNDDENQNDQIAQNDQVDQSDQIAQNADENQNGQPQGIAHTVKGKTVGDMVGAFQSIVTVKYIRGVKTLDWQSFNGRLWQRNYWEHIIRNEQSYRHISEYIINNPVKWEVDKFHK